MDNNPNDWRTNHPVEPRQKIIKRIMETLQRHMAPRGPEDVCELLRMAYRFEERIFKSATDKQDYLRQISTKMLTLEAKAQAMPVNDPQSRPVNPPGAATQHDTGTSGAAEQVQDKAQEQGLANRVQESSSEPFSGQPQQRQQQTAPQSLHGNVNASAMQYMAPGLPTMTGMHQSDLAIGTGSNILQEITIKKDKHELQPQQHQQQPRPSAPQHPKQQPHQQQLSSQLSSQTPTLPPTLQQQQQQLVQAQLLQQQKQHVQQQSQQQKVPPITPHSQYQQPQQSQQPIPCQQLSQRQEQLQQLQSAPQQPGSEAQQERPQQPVSSNQSGAIVDQQEAVWTQLQVFKDKYLNDLKNLHNMLSMWSQQPMSPEQTQKVKQYTDVIYRVIPYLLVAKEKIPPDFTEEKLKSLEARIINIMDIFKRSKANRLLQPEVTAAGQLELPPNQISQPLQQQQRQQVLSQMQLQNNKPVQLQESAHGPASTDHRNSPSAGVTTDRGASSSQQPSAQLHPAGSQTNTSQLRFITSLQPGGVNTMPLNAQQLCHEQQQRQLSQPQQELLQAQQQQKVQLHPHAQHAPPLSDLNNNASKGMPVAAKQVLLQQQEMKHPLGQQQQAQQLNVLFPQTAAHVVSSPQIQVAFSQASSSQQMSHQNSPANRQGATPPLKIPSPFMLQVSSSSTHEEAHLENATPAASTPGSVQTAQSPNMPGFGTPGTSVSTMMADYSLSPAVIADPWDNMQDFSPGMLSANIDPVERLGTKIDTISVEGLSSAAREMNAVIYCSASGKLGASAPGNEYSAIAEDLASEAKLRLQSEVLMNQDSNPLEKKLRHSIPVTILSQNSSTVNSFCEAESFNALERASMMKSHVKCRRLKVPQIVQEEIKRINDILIDTEVEVSEELSLAAVAEGKEGVVVSCLYKAVSVSPTLKRKMMVSQPCIWLIIPPCYPRLSPIFWSERMIADSDIGVDSTARDMFVREVRSLPPPVSLNSMVWCWDRSVRQALTDVAVTHGGGSFSTTMGVWESWD